MRLDIKKIELAMARAEVSGYALADVLGVSGSAISDMLSRIEAGAEIAPARAGRLAKALGVDPSEIVADDHPSAALPSAERIAAAEQAGHAWVLQCQDCGRSRIRNKGGWARRQYTQATIFIPAFCPDHREAKKCESFINVQRARGFGGG
jgi:transcriptional regulator with XRE-family HTH domain